MRRLPLLVVPFVLFLGACSNELRISEVDPNTGTFSGGEEVKIKGNGFPKAGVSVKFGNREATSIAIESDHTIKAVTPAGDPGTTSDVSVIFDDGRAFVMRNAFRYIDSSQNAKVMEKFGNKPASPAK